jgi:hypothetical protein
MEKKRKVRGGFFAEKLRRKGLRRIDGEIFFGIHPIETFVLIKST